MTRSPHDALTMALHQEGINFADERAKRILAGLQSRGFDVTANSNWKDREPQLVGLVQDEI